MLVFMLGGEVGGAFCVFTGLVWPGYESHTVDNICKTC